MPPKAILFEDAASLRLAQATALYNGFKLEQAAELALQASRSTPGESACSRARLLLLAGDALRWLRDHRRAEDAYEAAAQLFADCLERELELQARVGLALLSFYRGNVQEARHVAEEALAEARSSQSKQLEARATAVLSIICQITGDLRDSVDLCHASLQLYRELGQPVEIAETTASFSSALARAGRLEEARTSGAVAIGLFESAGYESGIANMSDKLALIAWVSLDFAQARDLMERRLRLERKLGRVSADALFNGSLAEFACGNYETARRLNIQAFELARKQSISRRIGPCCMLRTLIELHLDKPDEAIHFASLARDNHLENADAEAVLVPYYSAIACLSVGLIEDAVGFWTEARPLPNSMDSKIEAVLLLRAMEHILARKFWDKHDELGRATGLAHEWMAQLVAIRDK